MKILCLGDSLTETYAIDSKRGWVNLLNNQDKIETINAGICGDTTTGMLARCEKLVTKHKPSHIIILGGTNDLWYGLKDEFIISNIQAMSRHAMHYSVEVFIGLPTISYNLNELNFVQENYSECIRSFRTSLRYYCESQDKRFIDFTTNMNVEHFLDDGLHPNELGQLVIVKNIINCINS